MIVIKFQQIKIPHFMINWARRPNPITAHNKRMVKMGQGLEPNAILQSAQTKFRSTFTNESTFFLGVFWSFY